LTALGALVLAGTGVVATHRAADAIRYAPRQAAGTVMLFDWPSGGWLRLPARRTEVGGDHEEPLALQWAGTADRIEQVLQAGGWRRPPRWASRAALLWLLPSAPAGQLPVLAKFHQGEPPALSFERELDPSQRLVIRLWRTSYRVSTASDPAAPLWVGMATRERLMHPAGLLTLAKTEPDFAAPTAQLAKLLQTHKVAVTIRQRDALAVLLLQ
ncbi:MAG TPA: LssY C-terminal domain-containing protein, partial [Rhodoferax sp.]